MCWFVPRNWYHVNDAVAQIDTPKSYGPLFYAVGLPHSIDRSRDQNNVCKADEALVAGNVVTVSVTMRDREPDRVALCALEPFRDQFPGHCRSVAGARPGVNQERASVSEEEIEKGLFVMGAAGLPKDV